MALISPQESFLDSRLFDNFESLTDFYQTGLPDDTYDSTFHKLASTGEIPNKVYTALPPHTPITKWRRAEHTDVPEIEKLCTKETVSIYGDYNLDYLVESSLLAIVLLNAIDEVVAFIAVQDFPPIPFLPATDWEQWMDDMYQVRIYHSLNTRFIHLLVWNNRYETTFLKNILSHVFAENPYVEYILLILPYGIDLKGPYEEIFFFYLAIMDLAKEPRSVRKIREFKEKYLLGLYVAVRKFIGPDITFRKAKKEDNETINASLLEDYPELNIIFEENILLDLLQEPRDKKNKRNVIVSEWKEDEKVKYGLLTYFKHVNLDQINHFFDTFTYHGFKKYIDMNIWNNAYDKWNRVNQEHPLKHFDRTVKEESIRICNQDRKVSHSAIRRTAIFQYPEKHFSSNDQDDAGGDISTLDRGFSVSKMGTEEIIVEKNYDKDEEKKDYMQFELKRQTCLSYANEETVYKKEDIMDPKETLVYKSEENDKKHLKKNKSIAMEIELYLPPKNQDPRLVLNYLKYISERAPKDKMFILVSIRSHDNYHPLLHYFQGLERMRRTCDNRDLYVCHKLAITGLFVVREAEMSDFEEIMALTIRNPHYHYIHQDVFDILRNQDLPDSEMKSPFIIQRCYVFMCGNLLIGFGVVGQEDMVDYYIGNYNVEDFIYFSLHRRDDHGYVRHFVLIPSFLHLTAFFLRQIMKINLWTCLYTFMIPGHLMEEFPQFSIPSGLLYWIPVQPRKLPEYWEEGLGDFTPHGTLIHKNAQPFALYHMNYKMSGIHKKLYTFKIVVVGGGDLAISFLEHLIFSPTSWYMGYRNITLISQGGIANKFVEKYANIIKTMMVTSGKYDEDYLNRLSLFTWVDLVEGMVTSIDRKGRFLIVDEMYDFDYDYLFLFCGTQFVKPQSAAELVPNQECRVLIDEIKGIEKAYSEMPSNLFLINNDQDAFYALHALKEILNQRNIIIESKMQIVVYGHCLNALACIAGLLEFGIRGSLITLVEPERSPYSNKNHAFNTEIYNSIKSSLEDCNINAHYCYSFTCWETHEQVPSGRKITKVHFQSHNHVISVATIALFSFEPKTVHHKTRLALQKACLVFDEKLVIDSDFLTNDKNIYAAGSLTRYKKKYYCSHYNHENYSSHEIGAEIAYRFEKRIRLEEMGQKYLSKRTVTEFTSPTVVYCKLPGGWNYLHITKPGPIFPMQTLVAYQAPWGKVLSTGNSYDKNGPGYFRIIINHCELVCDILCFTTKRIDVHNMTCLYNKHESLLNQMCRRFDGELISDFFLYFREGWAYALYHDRFPLFMEEIQSFYLKEVANENVSFYEAVAYALNVCKWQKVSDKDKELLEDLFNHVPQLRDAIEKKLLEFMDYNQNQLTTYLTWTRFEESQQLLNDTRLLDPADLERGMLPLVPIQPEYIVPTPGHRKEIDDQIMECPLEKIFFQEPSGVDDESGSVHSDYVPEDTKIDKPYIEIDLTKADLNDKNKVDDLLRKKELN